MKKAKILCLHGFGTNAAFMKKQAAYFIKNLSNQAQFIFVEAPFQVPKSFVLDQKVIEIIQGQPRTWYSKYPAQHLKEQFFQQLDKIRITFQKGSQYYDGILGFSLGSFTSHFIMKLKQMKIINWKILDQIKFSINLNGDHLNFSLFNNYNKQLQIPSFHIISREDFMFSKSIIHTTQYKNPIIINHSQGHKFPKLANKQLKMLKQFIKNNNQKNEVKKIDFQILKMSKL